MIDFKIFKDITDKELLEIYKDILRSKVVGVRSRTLDIFANDIKEKCHLDVFSQATKFTEELFYEEVAMRYFRDRF